MVNKLLIAVITIVLIIGGYIIFKSQQETITTLRTLNPTSSGPKVIVIYSPGISDFHTKVTNAFANSLVNEGWSVDIVTASSQTIADLSDYSLLVIGGPIRGGELSKPIQDYMKRVVNLDGLRVFTLITSMGGAPQGEQMMLNWINSKNGVEAGLLSLATMAPNTPVDGVTDPVQIATFVAQKISQ